MTESWPADKYRKAVDMNNLANTRPLPPGTLIAVLGPSPDTMELIGRVVVDRGPVLVVESDEDIEWEAAIEYDFPTLPHRIISVSQDRVRVLVKRPERNVN